MRAEGRGPRRDADSLTQPLALRPQPSVESLRRYLFSIAYRMLGSAGDAEDVVQEAYLRYHSAPQDGIRSPKAYLSTVVTRLCLDQLKSARVARETYHGPWLPEPVPTADLEPTPQERVERGEDVSLAFLVLLERLTPDERAAYVLREAFGYDYAEIAAILSKSIPATRQLAHRARRRLTAARTASTCTPRTPRHWARASSGSTCCPPGGSLRSSARARRRRWPGPKRSRS